MSITEKQNQSAHVQMLAAQRNLYSTAKIIMGLQMILSGPIAVAVTLLALMKPEVKGYVALWGLTVLFFDLAVIVPWQRKLRDNGAKVQELFDCEVLGLSWNEIKAGKKPDPELIYERAQKYSKTGGSLGLLMDWYPVSVESVPNEWARLICQRANVFWDSKLRRRYATGICVVAAVVTVLIIWTAFHTNTTFSDFVAFVLVPAVCN